MLGNFVFQNTMIYMVFHSQTGALNLYHPTVNQVEIQNCCRNLDTLGVKYDILNAAEINERFSLFNLPHDIHGMYEHGGGFLVASKCVAAFQVSNCLF